MSDHKNILGVVLAGGRSSRMGQNKALLDFKGKPLIEHMAHILKQTGIKKVIISGQVKGYDSVEDKHPFNGPAKAIESIIQQFPEYDGFLFTPVDMPLLKSNMLNVLLEQSGGAYFAGSPLPAYVTQAFPKTKARSVKDLLTDYGVPPIQTPEAFLASMANTNTPEEWREITSQ